MSTRILEGDALTMLKTLPSESVQMVCTSPPYFGLRAYGTNPQVWGGDPEHREHEWGAVAGKITRDAKRDTTGSSVGWIGTRGEQPAKAGMTATMGQFCPCGAWRGELGSEPTPALFIEHLVSIFEEVKRVMRPDAVLFVNLGDSYSGSGKGGPAHDGSSIATGLHSWGTAPTKVQGVKAKSLLLIPERFAIAMQDAGWIVRSRIAWCKTSAMPESVRDRPTSAWEHIWLFAKSRTYYWDSEAVRGLGSSEGPTRIVQRSHLIDQRLILGHDFGLGSPPAAGARSPSGVDDGRLRIYDAVRYASALLQRPEFQDDLGLSSLDSEERQQLFDDANRTLVSGAPVVHGATVGASALLAADIAAECFLEQMYRLGVALPDGDVLREGLRTSLVSDSPRISRNGDAAIGVDDSSEVGQNGVFAHGKVYHAGGTTSRGANLRNFWLLGPEPSREQHYASFVSELPRRCIKAGTSERGQCRGCGAPWARCVERQGEARQKFYSGANQHGSDNRRMMRNGQFHASAETTGWQPSCTCDAGNPVPQVVLDPFLGSGTTALVADQLGRDAIGIELNPEYVAIARRRLESDAPMWTDPVVVETHEQLSMLEALS